MTLLAALLAALAVLTWWTPSGAASRLTRAGVADGPEPRTAEGTAAGRNGADGAQTRPATRSGAKPSGSWPAPPPGRDPRHTCLLAVGCGSAVAIAAGGWAGLLIGGLSGGVTGLLLQRTEPRAVRARRERQLADVPLAAELMAVTLRAGRPPERAVEVIARALPGPLGQELALVAETLRLGAPAEVAWERLLAEPGLRAFARAMVRSWDSGAPLSDLLERLARDYRRTVRAQADRRARSVGVKAALPLGVCFLPAFVLVGIVPLVAGAIGGLLGGAGP